jgi:hypothetical protein
MWPFFSKQKQSSGITDVHTESRTRPMKFSQLLDGMGDFSDLGNHDTAMKFWLPEPALEALKEISNLNGDSVSEALRQFFAHHCYGIYAFQMMNAKIPGIFKDPGPIMFSRGPSNDPVGKKRVHTYWVPELGKNVMPIKVWVPARIRNDLQLLATHVELNLSQYAREIVISRLLGHGTLPYRPEMLAAIPLPAAHDWCEGKDVPLRQLCDGEKVLHDEVKTVSEWVDA